MVLSRRFRIVILHRYAHTIDADASIATAVGAVGYRHRACAVHNGVVHR
jgi:hypothetical protein